MIVEDDVIQQERLKILLDNYPQLCISYTVQSVKEAVILIQKNQPELIFLDMELEGGSGLDILEKIISKEYKPCIICISANTSFAIKFIKFSLFDYLLKPIVEEDLNATIVRFLKENKERQLSKKLDMLLSLYNSQKKLKIRSAQGFILIAPEEIFFCKADWNYTQIFFSLENKQVVSMNLGKLTEYIDPTSFFRINRSTLINLNYLTHVNRVERQCYLVKQDEEISFSIPKVHIKELEQIFPF